MVLVYTSCPGEITNSDSFHFLGIPVWKINSVVLLLISVLPSAVWASSGTREAGGRLVRPGLWAPALLGSAVCNS